MLASSPTLQEANKELHRIEMKKSAMNDMDIRMIWQTNIENKDIAAFWAVFTMIEEKCGTRK